MKKILIILGIALLGFINTVNAATEVSVSYDSINDIIYVPDSYLNFIPFQGGVGGNILKYTVNVFDPNYNCLPNTGNDDNPSCIVMGSDDAHCFEYFGIFFDGCYLTDTLMLYPSAFWAPIDLYYKDSNSIETLVESFQAQFFIDSNGAVTTSETLTIADDITVSTTWYPNFVYMISGNIEVTSGDTLTILPGTVIKFDDTTPSSLTINGTLNSIGDETTGSEINQIFFSSLTDDIRSDTNQDNDSTYPAPGDWGGIIIGSGGVANFDYTTIRYAGATGTSEAQIYNNGGSLSLENSSIVYGTTYGIKNDSGNSDIESTELGFNDYGFYLGGGTADITDGNVIHDNNTYGIYNNTLTNIDAEGNYWGHSSGPGGFGPGLGDNVSDNVDFSPWDNNHHYIIGTSSVDNNEIRWEGSTQYSTEFSSAVTTWNALGNITIAPDTILTTSNLEVSDEYYDDVVWAGLWNPIPNPHTLQLNDYYLQSMSNNEIQNLITHELGHSLGLNHSYTGNVLYFAVTPQISLGDQDISDYYYLWP